MDGGAGNVFSLLKMPVLVELIAATPVVELSRGEALFQTGELCASLPVIESGDARIYSSSDTGREATLYWLEADAICPISLSALLQNSAYPATAVADASVRVRYLPGEKLKATISGRPEIFRAFLETFASCLYSNTVYLLAHIEPDRAQVAIQSPT